MVARYCVTLGPARMIVTRRGPTNHPLASATPIVRKRSARIEETEARWRSRLSQKNENLAGEGNDVRSFCESVVASSSLASRIDEQRSGDAEIRIFDECTRDRVTRGCLHNRHTSTTMTHPLALASRSNPSLPAGAKYSVCCFASQIVARDV